MKDDKDILTRLAHRDGMTVPPGYFEHLTERIASSLPARPELAEMAGPVRHRTLWQRVRPYVYMAAMFMGVWCMLKMFSLMSSPVATPLESNPVMAEAFSNDTFMNEYVIDDLSQWDIYDEMMEDGIDAAALTDSLQKIQFD